MSVVVIHTRESFLKYQEQNTFLRRSTLDKSKMFNIQQAQQKILYKNNSSTHDWKTKLQRLLGVSPEEIAISISAQLLSILLTPIFVIGFNTNCTHNVVIPCHKLNKELTP